MADPELLIQNVYGANWREKMAKSTLQHQGLPKRDEMSDSSEEEISPLKRLGHNRSVIVDSRKDLEALFLSTEEENNNSDD